MKNKMTSELLHVVNIYFVVPYFFGNQLSYFKKKGVNIHVACSPSNELKDYARQQGFQYLEVSILRKISLLQDLKAVKEIYHYIKTNRIETVTGHTPKGGLIAMVAAFLAGVKKRIYFRHGLVYETAKGPKRFLLITMERLTSFLATQIVCVSPSVYQRSLKDKLSPANKQLILANGTCNGIDVQRFSKTNIDAEDLKHIRTKYQISENHFVLGFIGRLVRDKGIIELVEAFKRIHQEYPFTKLLLVGMLEERDALPPETVKEIKSNPDIIFTGYVNNRSIEKFYALMNIFILPSYREGFPTSVLEASAMELPALTTEVTGCIDAILPGKTGLFITHAADDLYDKVKYLLDHPETRSEMGWQGRQMVIERFDEIIVWKELEKLYL